MNTQTKSAAPAAAVHQGPHPGMLAILYTVLFCAGLYPVTGMYAKPYWPGPWEPASVIVPYFQNYGGRVLLCLFLQLGAMICLGLFTATVVSRLHFLGARAAGIYIALFGGFLVVFDAMAGTMATWTMVHPSVAPHSDVVIALYYLAYGLGGPGFSIPIGTSHGRGLRHRCFHEAAAQVAHHPRPHPRRSRRTQLAASRLSQTPLPHPAHPLPRLHLDHRSRLPVA